MLSRDVLFGRNSELWRGVNIFICQTAKQLNLRVQRSYCLTNVILLFILDSEAQGTMYSISFMTGVFTVPQWVGLPQTKLGEGVPPLLHLLIFVGFLDVCEFILISTTEPI